MPVPSRRRQRVLITAAKAVILDDITSLEIRTAPGEPVLKLVS